jgi:hypothetical protein
MKRPTGKVNQRRRLTVIAVSVIALAVPALVFVPTASAAVTQVRLPISFTLSGCPSLPAGLVVSGSGDGLLIVNVRVDKNGVTHVEESDLVTGTATDSDGGTYVFNYHNYSSTDIAAGGFPVQVTTTDHFNLNGSGKANQLQAGFVASVTLTSPSDPPIFEFVNVRGNPFFCDPI